MYSHHLLSSFTEPYHRTQKNWLETIRNETVDKLWMETYKLNVLYKENWTAIANKEIEHFERALTKAIKEGYRHQEAQQTDARWSLADSWLFSFSVITTIGTFNHFFCLVDINLRTVFQYGCYY